MALVVEDGTGKSNADSYISLADAKTYNAAHRNSTAWQVDDDPGKEQGLRMGFQFINQNYEFISYPTNEDQAGAFPREILPKNQKWTWNNNEIPTEVKNANAELADIFITDSALFTDIQSGRIKLAKLEGLEIEYTEAGQSQVTTYRLVSALLTPFIKSSNTAVRI